MSKTKFKTEMEFDLRWGEMDALNHINNAQYFSYFEDARIHYFNKMKESEISLNADIGPILAQIDCNFKRPLTFPDRVTVGVGVTRLGNKSAKMDYEIYSHKDDTISASGSSVIVYVDYKKGNSVPIPEDFRAKAQEVDGNLMEH